LVLFLLFFSLEHRFEGVVLQFDFETPWHERVENGGLVNVGIDKYGSEVTNADFLHFLRRDASRLIIGEDFAWLTG
jgi:hypothetical protein